MIIDSFLFFQELDLLEIRLKYLYPLVDYFIIVEAKQSFTGASKKYIFEKNSKRYSKYINKIIYYKIEDVHYSYDHLINFLDKSNSKVKEKICNILKKHNYYDKNNLSHVLDSYHRECLHLALSKVCNSEDIVLLSDLDEIPSFQVLKNLKQEKSLKSLTVFVQNEFQYYLNNYANNIWYGTIACPYKLIKKYSLNEIRKESIRFPSISNSGYHFTSIGNKESIVSKIENWGHQEFNQKIVKDNIEENIKNGKDIFYRFKKNKNKLLNIEKSEIIDARMTKILLDYDSLIIKDFKSNIFFNIKYFYNQILFISKRIIKNPHKFFKKIFKYINF